MATNILMSLFLPSLIVILFYLTLYWENRRKTGGKPPGWWLASYPVAFFAVLYCLVAAIFYRPPYYYLALGYGLLFVLLSIPMICVRIKPLAGRQVWITRLASYCVWICFFALTYSFMKWEARYRTWFIPAVYDKNTPIDQYETVNFCDKTISIPILNGYKPSITIKPDPAKLSDLRREAAFRSVRPISNLILTLRGDGNRQVHVILDDIVFRPQRELTFEEKRRLYFDWSSSSNDLSSVANSFQSTVASSKKAALIELAQNTKESVAIMSLFESEALTSGKRPDKNLVATGVVQIKDLHLRFMISAVAEDFFSCKRMAITWLNKFIEANQTESQEG